MTRTTTRPRTHTHSPAPPRGGLPGDDGEEQGLRKPGRASAGEPSAHPPTARGSWGKRKPLTPSPQGSPNALLLLWHCVLKMNHLRLSAGISTTGLVHSCRAKRFQPGSRRT